ncbi:hypothetical protein [Sphaerimonospora mesophila]|uniref:hypothetical protein n=1 Tax=Sphaerimonospora mesophila TaxID=37483 RepID=UPI0006E399EF
MAEPYDTTAPPDVFASAKSTFNYRIGQLADAAAETFTHDRLEEVLAEAGPELLRQLLQAHLDLRAQRERQRIVRERGTGAAVTGADQVVRRRVETGHHRLLAMILRTARHPAAAARAQGLWQVAVRIGGRRPRPGDREDVRPCRSP